MLPTIKWDDGKVIMIDQRKLPGEEVYVECTDYEQMAEAIEKMIIRGAPAIGIAAAFGVAVGIQGLENKDSVQQDFDRIYERLEKTRPTARNLFWALERMRDVFLKNLSAELEEVKEVLLQEALKIEQEDILTNKKIGSLG